MVRRMRRLRGRQRDSAAHSGRESFCEAAGRLSRVSRFDQYRIVKDLLRRSAYTVGCQAPLTKKASFSPGHGGIVAPIALRGSYPSQRN
jgi:hypothetical protein